jgi:small subunit ribosomal protein S8
MSQDIIADTLNQMMNAVRAGKEKLVVKRHSKALISVLALAKLKKYIKGYSVNGTNLEIELGPIHGCKAVKPRYSLSVSDIEKYVKRYLPAREIGILIISTNQGLMTHKTAQEKNLGGCLIAYMY